VIGNVWKVEEYPRSLEVRFYFKIKKTWFRSNVTVYYTHINHKRFNLRQTFEDCSSIHYSKVKNSITETSGIFIWKRRFSVEEEQLSKIFYYSPVVLECLYDYS
jgi:hypothetical protein